MSLQSFLSTAPDHGHKSCSSCVQEMSLQSDPASAGEETAEEMLARVRAHGAVPRAAAGRQAADAERRRRARGGSWTRTSTTARCWSRPACFPMPPPAARSSRSGMRDGRAPRRPGEGREERTRLLAGLYFSRAVILLARVDRPRHCLTANLL
jgi:hypothetical protein